MLLQIKNLKVRANEKQILDGINLTVNPGEVHAIMGPNGSGKTTLSNTLAGREGYEITEGEISFKGKDLLAMDVTERARAGLFLAFQYPVEIPGVSNIYLLRAAVNAMRLERGESTLDAIDFLKLVRQKLAALNMDESFLYRNVNEGFSGGEKRNEMLQMELMQPNLAILDETDSGLDIDALKIVAEGINRFRSSERGIIMVTHYQRLLDYVKPDFVHVLVKGKIIKSGDITLAQVLESQGYDGILKS